MSQKTFTNWRLLVPSGLVLMLGLVFAVTPLSAQDTIANTSGNQTAGAMPPPTPPQTQGQRAGSAMQTSEQPTLAEETRALDASQNAAHPMQQPNHDQSLVPPLAPPAMDQPARDLRAELGIFMVASDGPGVRVRSVNPGSAAEAAGVRPGDFLLAVGGQNVELPDEVGQLVRQRKVGDTVELRIWRDRAEQLVTATLQEARRPQVRQTVNSPVYYQNNVVGEYVPGPVYRRQSRYYPESYRGGYYGDRGGYRYGHPYGGQYYGTTEYGYYDSPWGQGVNVGGFQFGWR